MTRVIGIGSELRRDDGFGPVVVRALLREQLPDGVSVTDYGTRAVHLAFDLADATEPVIFVDAADLGAEPGTVAVIAPQFPDEPTPPTGHDITLAGVAELVRRLGSELGEVLLVGCQPLDVSDGMGLTPPVAAAVPHAVACVLDLIGQDHAAHGRIGDVEGAER